jgi:serine/threonine protein kinase
MLHQNKEVEVLGNTILVENAQYASVIPVSFTTENSRVFFGTRNESEVAAKFINPSTPNDKSMLEAVLLSEYEVLEALESNRHIINPVDVFVSCENPLLVTEWAGYNLLRILQLVANGDRDPLSHNEAQSIYDAVGTALHGLHEIGVVVGDLKPVDIYVGYSGVESPIDGNSVRIGDIAGNTLPDYFHINTQYYNLHGTLEPQHDFIALETIIQSAQAVIPARNAGQYQF